MTEKEKRNQKLKCIKLTKMLAAAPSILLQAVTIIKPWQSHKGVVASTVHGEMHDKGQQSQKWREKEREEDVIMVVRKQLERINQEVKNLSKPITMSHC